MTQGGFRIASVAGIAVRLHPGVLVAFALVAWNLGGLAFPQVYPGRSGAAYAAAGLAAALLFFTSLLAHEIGHGLLARRYGITVRSMTLWLFGGVAELEGRPRDPGQAFRIAGIGPLISIAVALGCGALAVTAELLGAPLLVAAVFGWNGWMNLALALFNLVPALPLDGGRILHAALWRAGGDRNRATRRAAVAGRVFGFVLIGFGVMRFLAGSVLGGFWLAFIGWFLAEAARSEAEAAGVESALGDLTAGEVMTLDPVAVPAGITVAELVGTWDRRLRFPAYPVVDASGGFAGVVTIADASKLPRDRRAVTRVAELARPVGEFPVAAPGDRVAELVGRLGDDGFVLVLDGGRPTGLLTPDDVLRAAAVPPRAARPPAPVGRPR